MDLYLAKNSTTTTDHPPILTLLLEDYADIFQSPVSLLASRLQDHRILLLLGANPINVRPYRYPHFQKEKIEHQVSEMLKTGVIRPSSNPYSSPVLLVKEGWDLAFLCRISGIEFHYCKKILFDSNSG